MHENFSDEDIQLPGLSKPVPVNVPLIFHFGFLFVFLLIADCFHLLYNNNGFSLPLYADKTGLSGDNSVII